MFFCCSCCYISFRRFNYAGFWLRRLQQLAQCGAGDLVEIQTDCGECGEIERESRERVVETAYGDWFVNGVENCVCERARRISVIYFFLTLVYQLISQESFWRIYCGCIRSFGFVEGCYLSIHDASAKSTKSITIAYYVNKLWFQFCLALCASSLCCCGERFWSWYCARLFVSLGRGSPFDTALLFFGCFIFYFKNNFTPERRRDSTCVDNSHQQPTTTTCAVFLVLDISNGPPALGSLCNAVDYARRRLGISTIEWWLLLQAEGCNVHSRIVWWWITGGDRSNSKIYEEQKRNTVCGVRECRANYLRCKLHFESMKEKKRVDNK